MAEPLVNRGALLELDENPNIMSRKHCNASHMLQGAVHQRSIMLGFVVGLMIEGASLGWHGLLVKERGQVDATQSDTGPTVVALLLWSLVTAAAPFVVLAYLRGLIRPAIIDVKALSQIERRFGAGALIGVCSASAIIDSLIGFHGHMRFSMGTGVATSASCMLLPRIYRKVLLHRSERRSLGQTAPLESIDPEKMDLVELTPGTLTL